MMISTLAEIGHDVTPPAFYDSVPKQDRIAGIYAKSKTHKQLEKLQWALDMVTFMKAAIKAQSDINHIQHQSLKDVRGGLDFLRRIITEVSESIK